MSDIPTPRTDEEKFWSDWGGWVVLAKSFEELERELAAAQARCERAERKAAHADEMFAGAVALLVANQVAIGSQDLIAAGAEIRARRERLAEWETLCAWGGTPAHVEAFIKGQQERIHAAQNLELELAAANERIRRLTEAGDAMACEAALIPTDLELREVVKSWTKAKEAKP